MRKKAYYTSSEVATLLMVSEPTVRRLSNNNILIPTLTPGGHRRFTYDVLVKYATDHGMQLNFAVSEEQKHQIKILIVDDDKDFNEFLGNFFQENLKLFDEPVEVSHAYDGFEAGRLVEANSPDLVVLDIRMPGIGGEEVCKRICALPAMSESIIVAVTGFYTPEIEQQMIEAGADCCLKKPIARKHLQPFIKRLLIKNAGK